MFSTEQRQYLEEVLGLNSMGVMLSAGEATDHAQPPATHHELLILTYPLNEEGRALLAKILSSVKLANYTHVELAKISLAEFPEGQSATNVLAFIDYPTGKNKFEDSTWLVLPPVAQMTGANAAVVAAKKETWNLLQQFAKERA